jgi:hypothetical protein
LAGTTFVAKVPLYDTEISRHGIIELERDDEEIPPGVTLRVIGFDCNRNNIELTLGPLPAGRKVDIEFVFPLVSRAQPDGMEVFKKMLDLVFEMPPGTNQD